jgi:probable rRNA maturation factor
MILNRQQAVRVPLARMEEFVSRVCRELGLQPHSMTICLVSDSEIARMNRRYRGVRAPTDVLSFPEVVRRSPVRSGRPPRRIAERAFLGDVAISPATARRYARKHGRALADELRVLILHGALHLLGYDHETDLGEMELLETRLRRRLGIAL